MDKPFTYTHKGVVVAQEAGDPGQERLTVHGRKTRRYTAFLKHRDHGDVEEIDIDATCPQAVFELAQIMAREFYQPGFEFWRCEERIGLYW